jgi:hypothetical protein
MTAPVTLDPSEVVIGTANDVGLWIAPEGTAIPDIADVPADPWKPLGYASDDGPTIAQDTTSEQITPWQSLVPIRTVITERNVTVQFVLWQLNEETLALYFDTDPPTATGGLIDLEVESGSGGHIYAVLVDAKDGANQFRIGFTRANLDSAGDMQLQKGAAVPLDVTLAALDDAGTLARVQFLQGGA